MHELDSINTHLSSHFLSFSSSPSPPEELVSASTVTVHSLVIMHGCTSIRCETNKLRNVKGWGVGWGVGRMSYVTRMHLACLIPLVLPPVALVEGLLIRLGRYDCCSSELSMPLSVRIHVMDNAKERGLLLLHLLLLLLLLLLPMFPQILSTSSSSPMFPTWFPQRQPEHMVQYLGQALA